LNAILAAASIYTAHEETDTFVQGLIRIVGLPAGLLVHAIGAEGHGGIQVVLLMSSSFAFYWILIWAAWTAARRWHGPFNSRVRAERKLW